MTVVHTLFFFFVFQKATLSDEWCFLDSKPLLCLYFNRIGFIIKKCNSDSTECFRNIELSLKTVGVNSAWFDLLFSSLSLVPFWDCFCWVMIWAISLLVSLYHIPSRGLLREVLKGLVCTVCSTGWGSCLVYFYLYRCSSKDRINNSMNSYYSKTEWVIFFFFVATYPDRVYRVDVAQVNSVTRAPTSFLLLFPFLIMFLVSYDWGDFLTF